MDDLIDMFCSAQVGRGLSERSVEAYRCRLLSFSRIVALRGCQGIPSPEDMDAALLHARRSGWTRHTVRNLRMTMKLFGSWLHSRGHSPIDPACDLRIGEVPCRDLPAAPLSEKEVGELIESIPCESVVGLRNLVHFGLLYGCGLRLSESLSLTLEDVDLDGRTILVHGKGGHERLLPLLDLEHKTLGDYLAVRRTLLRGPDCGWLLLSRQGGQLKASGIQQWLRRHSERTIGKPCHPHLLRHSIAVHLVRGGVDIRHVQAFLGHSDIDITKVYLRMVPGHLKADYEAAMPWLG